MAAGGAGAGAGAGPGGASEDGVDSGAAEDMAGRKMAMGSGLGVVFGGRTICERVSREGPRRGVLRGGSSSR